MKKIFEKIMTKVAVFSAAIVLFCGSALGSGDTPIKNLRLDGSANGAWQSFTNLNFIISSNVVATNITGTTINATNINAGTLTAGNLVVTNITSSNTYTKTEVDGMLSNSGNWNTAYTWVDVNSNSVAYLYTRTNAWNQAVLDGTNWQTSIAKLIVSGDTQRWNTAGLEATFASNGVVFLNTNYFSRFGGSISGQVDITGDVYVVGDVHISKTLFVTNIYTTNAYVTVTNITVPGQFVGAGQVSGVGNTWTNFILGSDVIDNSGLIRSNTVVGLIAVETNRAQQAETAISNLAVQANNTATFASNGVVTLNGLTSGWNTASTVATWASNGVVILNGSTSSWNQAVLDGTNWQTSIAKLIVSGDTQRWNTAGIEATWASNGVVTLNGQTNSYAYLAKNNIFTGTTNTFDQVRVSSLMVGTSTNVITNILEAASVPISAFSNDVGYVMSSELNTSNWNTAYFWVNVNSNNVAYLFTRTNAWNQAVLDGTNWQTSVAKLIVSGDTQRWNTAGIEATWASNGVVTLNGLTSGWNTASIEATWASNKAVSAYDIATWASNGVVTLNGLTSGWNTASTIATWASNGVVELNGRTNAWNQAVLDGTNWQTSIAKLIVSGDTQRWNTAGLEATFASNGVVTLNGQTNSYAYLAKYNEFTSSNQFDAPIVFSPAAQLTFQYDYGSGTGTSMKVSTDAAAITYFKDGAGNNMLGMGGSIGILYTNGVVGGWKVQGTAAAAEDIINLRTMTNWTVRYGNVFSSSNNTYSAGTTQTFAMAHVNSNALDTVDVVNYQTMTNWVISNTSPYWDSMYALANNLDLIAASSVNVNIVIPFNVANIARGRLYIRDTNSIPFSRTATLTFWDSTNRVSGHEIWQSDMGLTCVFNTNATSIGATNIYVQDSTDFYANNLIYVMGATNEFARINSIGANNNLILNSPLTASHAISNGVSRVREFGGFDVFDSTTNKKLYVTFDAGTAITVNASMALDYGPGNAYLTNSPVGGGDVFTANPNIFTTTNTFLSTIYANGGVLSFGTNVAVLGNNTYPVGSLQTFALANITNNATSGQQIVNYQTMTNWTVRYGNVFTSSNNTYSAGTTQNFALATVTNNATASTDVVNYRTMTNYVAGFILGSGHMLMTENGTTSILYHVTSGNYTNKIGEFFTSP